MKQLIHSSNEDWKTDTSDSMINAFRQIMAENAQYEDDPYVGIFWYDFRKNELFGVREALAEDTEFKQTSLFKNRARTCRPLHEKVWRHGYYSKEDPRFIGDYTKIPRGRIFEVEGEGFIVCVGSWILDYPEAKQKIIDRFSLPEDRTKFKIDIHWDLGHGWSDF